MSPETQSLPIPQAAQLAERVLDAIEGAVVGKRPQLELILSGLIANGHVLLEDLPGLGKTLIARSFAQATGLDDGRIQFTPDLMPADITGSLLLDRDENRFVFRPGPIFHNIVIGDEINRAPPKTQAAMLEAMQERQVTVDGESHRLPDPFLVIATQNPIEFEGTYPLPEAQIDRFLLRTSLGYPTVDEDIEIVERRIGRRRDDIEVDQVITPDDVRALQQTLELVEIERSIIGYCVELVHATRGSSQVEAGSSPRGVDALVKLSRARALLAGRTFTTPDDVKQVAVSALAHRLVLRPELWVRGVGADTVVTQVLDTVPAPTTVHPDA